MLDTKTKERIDVDVLAGIVFLRSDTDCTRLTPGEARSLAVFLTHAAEYAERSPT